MSGHLEASAFHERAMSQRFCMSVDCPKPRAQWDAHHVVYEQHLRRAGLEKFDVRNALRLCRPCHFAHHGRGKVLSTRSLTDSNLSFLIEVYARAVAHEEDPDLTLRSALAADYLERHYRVAGDRRMEALLACR